MDKLVIVRGGGDIASGTICKLHNCGFKVIVLETATPSSIRRKVSFSEAVYEGECIVEGIKCKLTDNVNQVYRLLENDIIPIIVDEKCDILTKVKPDVLIDAILAKKNLGTKIEMAPLTIGLGPGFTAGKDVHVVVETMRGHDLGKLIYSGSAYENTATPGIIDGFGKERVIYSADFGEIKNMIDIGEAVEAGQVIAKIGETNVHASITGVLRGIIRDGFNVLKGLKIADIDPRKNQYTNCFTISDKARCIAGAVIESVLNTKKIEFLYSHDNLNEKEDHKNVKEGIIDDLLLNGVSSDYLDFTLKKIV